jgi:CubicO group peptidase (beta-lactamase class C family)
MLIKDGNIVFEKYQYGTNEKSRFNSESMAKSFTALAVGKAVEEGYIRNLDQKIDAIVPELVGSPVGKATVRQALNMVCGHKFKFGGDTAFEYLKIRFGGKDFTKYTSIYDYYRDLTPEEPGKKFSYDPHCTDALSMVISKTTGKRLGKYFEEKIWSNLNTLDRGSWMNMGINRSIDSGASQFNASIHDFSQIALMVLNDGLVDGRQVVSKEWINQMTSDTVPIGDYPSRYKKYGYYAPINRWF